MENSDFSKVKILCVEEVEGRCEYFRFLLPDYEIKFLKAADHNLPLISQEPFDLYILDFTFIENTGIEFCRLVSQIAPDKPIIYSSANWEKYLINSTLDAGASIHLEKPYLGEELITTIDNFLNKKRH